MSLKLLAIDLGKRSFHCHGIDSDGLIISRKTSHSNLLDTIRKLAPETVAMEACASAHYWGRLFLADGRQVLLINPRFVKPFVKGSKNDAADAGGNLRSRFASNHAVRSGQIDRAAGSAIPSSCTRARCLRPNCTHKSHAGASRRIWRHLTPRRMALSGAGAGRHRGRRALRSHARTLRRPARRTPRPRSPTRQARPATRGPLPDERSLQAAL